MGLVGGGLLLGALGVLVLILGDAPGATPVDGADPRGLGLTLLVVGGVAGWMGSGLRHGWGWAITPEGVLLPRRTVPWDNVGWLGVVVDDRRQDGRVRQRWRIALRDDEHGEVAVCGPISPDAERVAELSRAVAAAWLVGAPPAEVPFLLSPPEDDPIPGREELADAWRSIREGRWAEIHDIGRVEGAVLMPGELHAAGLEHLSEVMEAPDDLIARRVPPRGRRLRIAGIPVRLPGLGRSRDAS